MIESFFVQEGVRARLRQDATGSFVESLASSLAEEGYSRGYARRELRGAARFGKWLAERGLALEQAEEAAANYLEGLGRRPNGRRPLQAKGVTRLVQLLRDRGVILPPESPAPSEVETLLAAFDTHLERVVGLSVATRNRYLTVGARFLRTGDSAKGSWTKCLNAARVVAFVHEEASRGKTSAGCSTGALRSLLRFLVGRGEAATELVAFVPSVPRWRFASLPRYLEVGQVERVLGSCDEGTAGLRDRAILLLLARLGLRAIEVALLRLEHLDWHEGIVRVPATKTLRGRSLPLLDEVGAAIGVYLERARPRSPHREVFLRIVRPHAPLAPHGITSLAKRRLRAAGVSMRWMGAHVLRHSAATHMVRRGASFKEVADVLGHQRLATTNIYAKLDTQSLAAVAMPWPGGAR